MTMTRPAAAHLDEISGSIYGTSRELEIETELEANFEICEVGGKCLTRLHVFQLCLISFLCLNLLLC